MANKLELKNAVTYDLDFIAMPRYKCSLKKLVEKNPNGVTDILAAQSLYMTVDEFQSLFQSAFTKLRSAIGNQ